jgi:hypothetical protein
LNAIENLEGSGTRYSTPPTQATRDSGHTAEGCPLEAPHAMEAVCQADLSDQAAAVSEPAQQLEDFNPDASLAIGSDGQGTMPVRTTARVGAPIIVPAANPRSSTANRTPSPEEAPQAQPVWMPTVFPTEIKIKNII